MTRKEAIKILKKIIKDPGIADQFTEDEIEKLEEIASGE